MFQKSSGKVSQHWESSTEVLANIPKVGTVFSEKKGVYTTTNNDSGIVNRESNEYKTVYFPLFIGI